MIALDLFAGTGWGVACQRLGIEEYGVEIMPEARAVRAANGMKTWYADVWQGLEADVQRFDAAAFFDLYSLLIASPPCQTFSLAGGGAGRRALDEVLKLIDDRAYLDPAALRAFGEAHDPRTALVLTPLAYIARDVPLHVVLEQVPPVLPVWERYAEEMRAWGYSVWTGILSAEQYGVPQTRKRAILIARADGVEAAPPPPSHSRYYPRDPARLDPGVEPWVSMAEALGWDRSGGTYFHPMSYGRRGVWPNSEPAPTIRGVQRDMPKGYKPHPRDANSEPRGEVFVGHQYPDSKDDAKPSERQRREVEKPAPTITGGSSAALWEGMRGPWGMTDRPYPTVASGTEKGGGTDPLALGGSGARKILKDAQERGEWVDEREGSDRGRDWMHETAHSGANGPKHRPLTVPARTVTSDFGGTGFVEESEVPERARELYRDVTPVERYGDRAGTKAERVTIAEAAALQSYPPGFVWDAEVVDPRTKKLKPITKTKTFLQIGNAVPPLLAEAILIAATERPSHA